MKLLGLEVLNRWGGDPQSHPPQGIFGHAVKLSHWGRMLLVFKARGAANKVLSSTG